MNTTWVDFPCTTCKANNLGGSHNQNTIVLKKREYYTLYSFIDSFLFFFLKKPIIPFGWYNLLNRFSPIFFGRNSAALKSFSLQAFLLPQVPSTFSFGLLVLPPELFGYTCDRTPRTQQQRTTRQTHLKLRELGTTFRNLTSVVFLLQFPPFCLYLRPFRICSELQFHEVQDFLDQSMMKAGYSPLSQAPLFAPSRSINTFWSCENLFLSHFKKIWPVCGKRRKNSFEIKDTPFRVYCLYHK